MNEVKGTHADNLLEGATKVGDVVIAYLMGHLLDGSVAGDEEELGLKDAAMDYVVGGCEAGLQAKEADEGVFI